jgi:hypothetical protein
MAIVAMLRLFIATTVLLSGFCFGEGTVGIFQGLVIQGSSGEGGAYIYVQGKNGNLRRVKIAGAKIYYADSIPASQRIKSPVECLREHPEVKVIAEQGSNGEWKAQEIVIIRLSQSKVEVVLRTA